jgi:hypothetical protein
LRNTWQRSKSTKQKCHANNFAHRYLPGIHNSAKRPVQATSILHAPEEPAIPVCRRATPIRAARSSRDECRSVVRAAAFSKNEKASASPVPSDRFS